MAFVERTKSKGSPSARGASLLRAVTRSDLQPGFLSDSLLFAAVFLMALEGAVRGYTSGASPPPPVAAHSGVDRGPGSLQNELGEALRRAQALAREQGQIGTLDCVGLVDARQLQPPLEKYLAGFDSTQRDLALRQCWALAMGPLLRTGDPRYQELVERMGPDSPALERLEGLRERLSANAINGLRPTGMRAGTYTAPRGSTLSGISVELYGTARYAPALFGLNAHLIGDSPRDLEAGTTLVTPSGEYLAIFEAAREAGIITVDAEGRPHGALPPESLNVTNGWRHTGARAEAGMESPSDLEALGDDAINRAFLDHLTTVEPSGYLAVRNLLLLLNDGLPFNPKGEFERVMARSLSPENLALAKAMINHNAAAGDRSRTLNDLLLGGAYRGRAGQTAAEIATEVYGHPRFGAAIEYLNAPLLEGGEGRAPLEITEGLMLRLPSFASAFELTAFIEGDLAGLTPSQGDALNAPPGEYTGPEAFDPVHRELLKGFHGREEAALRLSLSLLRLEVLERRGYPVSDGALIRGMTEELLGPTDAGRLLDLARHLARALESGQIAPDLPTQHRVLPDETYWALAERLFGQQNGHLWPILASANGIPANGASPHALVPSKTVNVPSSQDVMLTATGRFLRVTHFASDGGVTGGAPHVSRPR